MRAHRTEGASRPFKGFLMLHYISRLIVLITAWILVGSVATVHALSPLLREYHIKAAFLYNFAKFVEWPDQTLADTSVPIGVGVLGKDPFGSALDSINGKTVRGRSLVIKRFETVQDLEFCHVLFISSSEEKHLASILESLKDRSVLTVSEAEQFTQCGGIIKLTEKGNRIRFEINLGAADRARLKISSKLLKLATIVK